MIADVCLHCILSRLKNNKNAFGKYDEDPKAAIRRKYMLNITLFLKVGDQKNDRK